MNRIFAKSPILKKLGLLGLVAASGAFLQPVHAQETLAGVGMASAAGAGLGAAAAGNFSANQLTRGVGGAPSPEFPEGAGNAGPIDASGNARDTNGTAAQSFVPATQPQLQSFGQSGQAVMRNLLRGNRPLQSGQSVARRTRTLTPRRVARLSPQARKKLVLGKYKIPPVSWLGSYLPQDRYKLGKAWAFVSTEDSKYYYSPQALARLRFNPNRVIGFKTWREALLAGYQPDPYSLPEPSADLYAIGKALTQSTRSKYAEKSPNLKSFYQFVEYVYAGQVPEDATEEMLRYIKSTYNTLNNYADTKWQARATSVTALRVLTLQQPRSDLPVVAGSPKFEQNLLENKNNIRDEVYANNAKIDNLAVKIAIDIAFPPGSERRRVYEYEKALFFLEHDREFNDILAVSSYMPAARIVAQKQLGLRYRNAESEIAVYLNKVSAGAVRTADYTGEIRAVQTRSYRIPPIKGSWLNYYLPIDRKRIQAGLWKYVSSDMTDVVYKPSDPRMRLQPRERVIGFASLNDALEAGYRPDLVGGINIRTQVAAARKRAADAKKAQTAPATSTAGNQGQGAANGNRPGTPPGAPPTGGAAPTGAPAPSNQP